MDQERKSTYRGYTEARAKAYAKYIEQYKEVKVRMKPELYEQVRAYLKTAGENSVNAFIIRAIEEAMNRT